MTLNPDSYSHLITWAWRLHIFLLLATSLTTYTQHCRNLALYQQNVIGTRSTAVATVASCDTLTVITHSILTDHTRNFANTLPFLAVHNCLDRNDGSGQVNNVCGGVILVKVAANKSKLLNGRLL